MEKVLDIKFIVITGVSSGIGESFVKKCLETTNYHVIGLGRNNIARLFHERYTFIPLDLLNSDSIQNALNNLQKITAKIDFFINNASFGYRGTFEDMPLDDLRNQFEINVFGPVELLQGIIHIYENSFQIINISALGALIDTPTIGFYGASKLSAKKSLDILSLENNIQVHHIYLGAVKSNFGKNIVSSFDRSKSHHQELYKEWQERFRYFFKQRNTSDEVAEALLKVIHGKKISFLTRRDKFIAISKRFFPSFLYTKVINFFYRYET